MELEYRSTDKRYVGDNRLIMWKRLFGHIDWHLDVGSSHPSVVFGRKGFAVRELKAVRELGLKRCETV